MHADHDHPTPGRARSRRPRRWRSYSVTGVLGLTVLAGQCAPQQCAPAPAAAPSALQHVVDLTNAERARAGLPALGIDARLMAAAQGHSADQAGRDTMTHTGSDGSNAGTRITRQGFTWRSWAENVAMGYPDAPSVMAGWMDSPGHRANVLSANVTHIGVGLAHAADGTPYWTQVFAAPR